MADTFDFVFDSRYLPLLRLAGITPERTSLRVDDAEVAIRFGTFSLTVPRDNITTTSVTGPHQPLRALGIRMSLADRGLTLGTSVERMVCMEFARPVRLRPFDITGHPGLSVSVERPQELATLLEERR